MNKFFTEDFFRFISGFMILLLVGLALVFAVRWAKSGEASPEVKTIPAATTSAQPQ